MYGIGPQTLLQNRACVISFNQTGSGEASESKQNPWQQDAPKNPRPHSITGRVLVRTGCSGTVGCFAPYPTVVTSFRSRIIKVLLCVFLFQVLQCDKIGEKQVKLCVY